MSISNRSSDHWPYIDLLFALMVGFMALAVIAFTIPVTKSEKAISPGNVIFEMWWPKGIDADVDLWVRAPGDDPVGYAHKSSIHCDLVRDDLGMSSDPESRNYETTICRGIPDGEWIANVVLYSYHASPQTGFPPINVTVKAAYASNGVQTIAQEMVPLVRVGQEATAFRFTTQDKKLVPDSVDQLPAKLWGGVH